MGIFAVVSSGIVRSHTHDIGTAHQNTHRKHAVTDLNYNLALVTTKTANVCDTSGLETIANRSAARTRDVGDTAADRQAGATDEGHRRSLSYLLSLTGIVD